MRRPLPLRSASLPSGLKMRRGTVPGARPAGRCAGSVSGPSRTPSPPTPVCRSHTARTMSAVTGSQKRAGASTR